MQLVMVMQTSKLISLLIMCYGKSVLKSWYSILQGM